MNTWPGPKNIWEGVDAYFTGADSPGMLVLITLVVCCVLLGIVISAAKHEAQTAKDNE